MTILGLVQIFKMGRNSLFERAGKHIQNGAWLYKEGIIETAPGMPEPKAEEEEKESEEEDDDDEEGDKCKDVEAAE